MHAGFLDMLHDAGDEHVAVGIADGVHIHFDGVMQEPVDQHRVVAGNLEHVSRLHGDLQRGFVRHDDHAATAQNVGRAQDDGEPDFLRRGHRFIRRHGGGVLRLLQFEVVEQNLKPLAVFREIDGVGAGAEDRHAFFREHVRQLQRRLAAELHDHAHQRALGLLDSHDLQHVFGRQRLEIETVGGVVIGGDGFRVAVDHDGLETLRRQRERRVAAAIVELDALTDAVGAAAEDDDLLLVRRLGLAFDRAVNCGLIGRIHVRRDRGEFGGAAIDALERRMDVQLAARGTHVFFRRARQLGEARIGEAHGL